VALYRAGMAELQVGATGDVLQALGLGSCIGLVMVDRVNHIGGMVHVMLPDSAVSRDGIPSPGKFADTGVPLLLEKVVEAGGVKSRMVVKMAGGAEMFAFAGKDSPSLSIGKRNYEAVSEQLKLLGMRVDSTDVGGSHGRTLEIDLTSLVCTVKVVGKQPVEI